jgi:hypothetical protein
MQTPKKIRKVFAWIPGVILGLVIIAYIGLNVLIGWGVYSDTKKAVAKS